MMDSLCVIMAEDDCRKGLGVCEAEDDGRKGLGVCEASLEATARHQRTIDLQQHDPNTHIKSSHCGG